MLVDQCRSVNASLAAGSNTRLQGADAGGKITRSWLYLYLFGPGVFT